MDFQTFMNELNIAFRGLGLLNPPVRILDDRGNIYLVREIYAEDGLIGIDIKVPNE